MAFHICCIWHGVCFGPFTSLRFFLVLFDVYTFVFLGFALRGMGVAPWRRECNDGSVSSTRHRCNDISDSATNTYAIRLLRPPIICLWCSTHSVAAMPKRCRCAAWLGRMVGAAVPLVYRACPRSMFDRRSVIGTLVAKVGVRSWYSSP